MLEKNLTKYLSALFVIANLGVCLGLASVAHADDVIDAQTGSLITVKNVSYEVEKVDARTSRLHVMAVAQFPNSCYAPSEKRNHHFDKKVRR